MPANIRFLLPFAQTCNIVSLWQTFNIRSIHLKLYFVWYYNLCSSEYLNFNRDIQNKNSQINKTLYLDKGWPEGNISTFSLLFRCRYFVYTFIYAHIQNRQTVRDFLFTLRQNFQISEPNILVMLIIWKCILLVNQ